MKCSIFVGFMVWDLGFWVVRRGRGRGATFSFNELDALLLVPYPAPALLMGDSCFYVFTLASWVSWLWLRFFVGVVVRGVVLVVLLMDITDLLRSS